MPLAPCKQNGTNLQRNRHGFTNPFNLNRTYNESQEYYYRVKAKNQAGLSSVNYSNELSVVTGSDMNPPVVQYVRDGGGSTIILKFSEKIEKVSAENIANYTLSSGAGVAEAKRALDGIFQAQGILGNAHGPDGIDD